MNKCFFVGMLSGVIVICLLLLVFGVRFTSDIMGYDQSKVVTMKGKVVSLDEFACPAAEGELGAHLILKTAGGDYQIHLAPSRVMRSVNWKFQPGQEIEVTGAKVKFHGQQGLLARQIARGDEIFTFRDEHGKLLVQQ
jgi:hypothetical protein